MITVYQILLYIALPLAGYLIGAINNAVIISNKFYQKDVRHYGSKNAGGTNTSRVFGRRAGFLVIFLDIAKGVIVYWGITLLFLFTNIGTLIIKDIVLHLAMFFVAVGHVYPVYYKFKGGKAVSVIASFVISTNWMLFLFGLFIFLIVLIFTKIVSLSSILMTLFVAPLSFLLLNDSINSVTFYNYASNDVRFYIPTLFAMAILLIFRHRENIVRLLKGTENKITLIRGKDVA